MESQAFRSLLLILKKKNLFPKGYESVGEMIFADLLLLLGHVQKYYSQAPSGEGFLFTTKISYLDEIWHQFILCTQLYSNFCQKNFGHYLHHEPSMEPESAQADLRGVAEIYERQIDRLKMDLGIEFVTRIYRLYPSLYSGEIDAKE